jgi:carbonic anhydrase
VLRTLVLARYLLGVERVMVVAHTKCRMAGGSEEDVHDAVRAAGGPDTRSISFLVATDQEDALRMDVQRARSWPYLDGCPIGGFLYDVDSGRVDRVC